LYKGDVAGACATVLGKKERRTEIFNVSGEPATMREIVSNIEDALGKRTLPVSLPPGLLRTGFAVNSKTFGLGKISRLGETVEKWLSDETFSAESLKKIYGFEAQTGIREAIRREVEWYLDNK
jgi:nucleoside-diphosphate-sugar epimerase